MTIAEIVAEARRLFFEDSDARVNQGTEENPDFQPYNYFDASTKLSQDLSLADLTSAINDLLQNHHTVELDGFHTHCIGVSSSAVTYIDVMRSLLEAFIAQQLGKDRAVRSEEELRHLNFSTAK